MPQIFPLGIALGTAFCNRDKERKWLADNIKHCRHSILISPRRYGKTSLANQVILENKLLHAKFDLLLIADELNIQDDILTGIAKVIAKILPLHRRSFDTLKKFMASLRPELNLSEHGMKITFTPKAPPKITIMEALEQLDKLATEQGKRIVLLMDEFQQIATIKNNQYIEAAIRHAAERAQSICYIFSGSNRHLLTQMFQDSSRPLYHLCDEIRLDRITQDDYEKFMQKAAKKQWQCDLTETVLATIFDLTKRHPYYVNLLCSRLWRHNKPPTQLKVTNTWNEYCLEQHAQVTSELANLSPNQRAVIRELAKQPTQQPTSRAFQQNIRLSNASTVQALGVLRKKDLIYVDEKGITRPLDPVIENLFGDDDTT